MKLEFLQNGLLKANNETTLISEIFTDILTKHTHCKDAIQCNNIHKQHLNQTRNAAAQYFAILQNLF